MSRTDLERYAHVRRVEVENVQLKALLRRQHEALRAVRWWSGERPMAGTALAEVDAVLAAYQDMST